jgi:ribosomal protein L7/L12
MTDPQIGEIKQRLALVEARLEQLASHLNIAPQGAPQPGEFDPNDDPEIQDLLAKGNLAQAVKRYRELTGASIAQAQAAIKNAQE